ncbi:uncharacterized protein BP5553_03595 [Venustampulla echinocandica]|uniref:Chromatin modification-related protein EAF3 n=1 Tax=Venustampulla echinocandica TaxID=2656787 RepID=A0A370TUP2_9HELO|nr:uncharacterized protein BP5553_03595 [Venustampulla echinocandica]RDL39255.1 hypothetical protein BP5553_03595 [Venustampulla echinocandica]
MLNLPDRTKQWDDWVPGDRVRKFTDENKELAAQLHNQMKALQRAPKSVSKKRANGSDFSSARGSEERHTSVAAQGGRGGARRNRDYDLEHVFGRGPSMALAIVIQLVIVPKLGCAFRGTTFDQYPEMPRSARRTSAPKVKRAGSPNGCVRATNGKGRYAWEDCLAPDEMLLLPPPGHHYLARESRYKRRMLLDAPSAPRWDKPSLVHPKLAELRRRGKVNRYNRLYYTGIPANVSLPLAGIITTSNLTEQQEENFHARPSIKLVIPDHIKAILVDDWENVTKNQQVVPLPSAHPVNSILDDYLEYEMPKRQAGSAQADILEEVIAGLKDYFDKCLGRILLYRFERQQYSEIRESWMSNKGDLAGKGAGDTYGAEHLCRLLVSLPELIAQTNMDMQSVNRLREELTKMTNWLGKHAETYFAKEYEIPSQDYVEKARGA